MAGSPAAINSATQEIQPKNKVVFALLRWVTSSKIILSNASTASMMRKVFNITAIPTAVLMS